MVDTHSIQDFWVLFTTLMFAGIYKVSESQSLNQLTELK